MALWLLMTAFSNFGISLTFHQGQRITLLATLCLHVLIQLITYTNHYIRDYKTVSEKSSGPVASEKMSENANRWIDNRQNDGGLTLL